jgi:xylulokinase
MSSQPYILGLDIGTESTKAILFNLKGKSIARAYIQYSVKVPEPSWAEQDPQLWWNAVKKSVSELLKRTDLKKEQVACVGVSGQSPVLVPVDKRGKPLADAIIWMDRRAVKQAEEIAKVTGFSDDPSMSLPKALWLRETRPQIFRRTHKFLQSTDFVEFKLTGKFVTDWFNASTFHFDLDRQKWPTGILSELQVPVDKLPDVLRPAEIVGTVTDKAASETGLRKGTPVVAGGIDAYMAMVGVNALTIGSVCEITGSSTCLMVPSNHRLSDPENRVHCEKFPLLPDFWVTWGTMSTTGASLRWFRSNFGRSKESYAEMDAEAEKASLGSDGLIFLPYLMGERSPIWDTSARGVFLGFSLNHSRSQFIRAILEGCAFGIRHNLETIEDLGVKTGEVRSCGGAAGSKIFGQIKADVTGKPIVIPREIEAPALGAAISAAVGISIYPDLAEAAKNMVQTRCRIEPQEAVHRMYDRYFEMYKDAYVHLREYFERYYSLKNTK